MPSSGACARSLRERRIPTDTNTRLQRLVFRPGACGDPSFRRRGSAMKITGASSMTAWLLAAVLAVGRSGVAGPTDTPLPTFSDGKAAVAVYTAFGVIKHSNLETDFMCTNTGTAAVDIGLEVFDETG